MRQFLFESKKMMKKKSVWTAVFITLLTLLVLSYFHFSAADRIRNGNIVKQENVLAQYKLWIEDAETELQIAEKNSDAETGDAMAAVIEKYTQSIVNQEKWISDYTQREWKTILEEDIADFELYSSEYGGMAIEGQRVKSFTLRAALEEKRWFLKNGIDPVVQNTSYNLFVPTIYEDFTGRALDYWKQVTARYGDTGLTYFYGVMPNFLIPIFILIGCFLFGNSISGESGKKKKGLQLHFVQPVSKTALFLSKYVSGLMATLIFVGLLVSAILLSGEFGNGIGSLDYPILVYEGAEPNPYGSEFNALNPENDQFHFIPLSEYLKDVLMMGLSLLFFTYSLYFLLALGIRNQSITILVTGGILFGGMTILPVSAYNPFTYVDIHRALNGEIATLAFNPAIGFQHGMLALFVAGTAVLLAAFIGFRVKSRNVAA